MNTENLNTLCARIYKMQEAAARIAHRGNPEVKKFLDDWLNDSLLYDCVEDLATATDQHN